MSRSIKFRRPQAPAVVFDMDGTLVDVNPIRHHVAHGAGQFDEFIAKSVYMRPHEQVVDLARTLAQLGYQIIIVTARNEKYKAPSQLWLEKHKVPVHAMFMRREGDDRLDSIVKDELLDEVASLFDVKLAVDDNPYVLRMWEENGVPVIDVGGWPDDTDHPTSMNPVQVPYELLTSAMKPIAI